MVPRNISRGDRCDFIALTVEYRSFKMIVSAAEFSRISPGWLVVVLESVEFKDVIEQWMDKICWCGRFVF